MYFVYIIENLKKSLYIGFTNDVENRLKEHQRGETYTTRRLGGPWRLIYTESCLNKNDAIGREGFLKSGAGKKFIKKQLFHYFKTNS